jgi:hypothetical protein
LVRDVAANAGRRTITCMRAVVGLVIGSFAVLTLLTALVLVIIFIMFMPRVAARAGGLVLSSAPLLVGFLVAACGLLVVIAVVMELALRGRQPRLTVSTPAPKER